MARGGLFMCIQYLGSPTLTQEILRVAANYRDQKLRTALYWWFWSKNRVVLNTKDYTDLGYVFCSGISSGVV